MLGINESIQKLYEILQAVFDPENKVLNTSGSGGGGGGGGSSQITSNTSIEYGEGAVTDKTQRVVIANSDPIPSAQLTATGSTDAIATNGAKIVGITIRIGNIEANTVVVRAEVSNVNNPDPKYWDTASLNGQDIILTANGTKALLIADCGFGFTRVTVVSISGGAPIIDVDTRLA